MLKSIFQVIPSDSLQFISMSNRPQHWLLWHVWRLISRKTSGPKIQLFRFQKSFIKRVFMNEHNAGSSRTGLGSRQAKRLLTREVFAISAERGCLPERELLFRGVDILAAWSVFSTLRSAEMSAFLCSSSSLGRGGRESTSTPHLPATRLMNLSHTPSRMKLSFEHANRPISLQQEKRGETRKPNREM